MLLSQTRKLFPSPAKSERVAARSSGIRMDMRSGLSIKDWWPGIEEMKLLRNNFQAAFVFFAALLFLSACNRNGSTDAAKTATADPQAQTSQSKETASAKQSATNSGMVRIAGG